MLQKIFPTAAAAGIMGVINSNIGDPAVTTQPPSSQMCLEQSKVNHFLYYAYGLWLQYLFMIYNSWKIIDIIYIVCDIKVWPPQCELQQAGMWNKIPRGESQNNNFPCY